MFSKNEHTQVSLLDRSATFMNDIVVSKDGVIKLLKGLNPSKALGPDELHPRVLCLFLFVLRLNVPVNNFSVMSERSHRFLRN